MTYKQLIEEDLTVGEPVRWHIYDGKGRLLLKKGMALRSPRQIAKIIRLKGFVNVDEKDDLDSLDKEIAVNDALSPFHHIDIVMEKLDKIFRYIVYKPANPAKNIPDKLFALSKSIVELCEYDMDATLGSIHVGKSYDYTIIHPLYCAIISYVLANRAGMHDTRVHSLMAAALTSNLGMFELQNKLMEQRGPLTQEQKVEVEKHTMRSTVLLKRIGVIDKLWLEIVLQHHEKQDGTGYPRKLSGEDFIQEARYLALADRYHAMVSPRNYRAGLSPTEALKKIFQGRGQEVDNSLSEMLIKDMGIFPPGSFVQLANEEIAIVTRRGQDRMKPLAKSIIRADGSLYHTPLARDTSQKEFRIMGLTNQPKKYQNDLLQLWDYSLD